MAADGMTGADQFGHIEARGIDYVPASERHGRPRELFWVWAAANVNYLYIVLGGLLMVLGLNVWQGMAVVLVGNLFWVAIGVLATSGPPAGAPSSVISRSMFGVRGNRVYTGLFNWPSFIAYEAINLCLGSLAGFALADHLGLATDRPTKFLVVVATAAVTLVISVYGHATILRMSGVFTAVLAAAMVVLGGYVVTQADWGYVADASIRPSGGMLWGTMLLGITVIASSPLSWGISADYARYLPADVSKPAVAAFTTLGGFIPAVALGWIGVLAGSLVDMNDPQTSLAEVLPGWFYPVFLLMIVLGCVTNNILTMYSSGLCLQAVGIRLPRSITVLFDGALGVALACYALFVSDFTSTLNNILELSVALLGPCIAIYLADITLRRNSYDGRLLHEETPDSPFWFHGGVNWAGFAALGAGTFAASLWLNTTSYVGPLAARFDGADLSSLVGPVVAIGVYVILVKVLYPEHIVRPVPTVVPAKQMAEVA
ncbi:MULTISPECIES: purine-cytosine permease family protein [unclassified Nocardioides]|uniref:purine-cytosine permease family protein n=1 Tax=unclassified Nocardioides TaxID=2615069 RepID=UPI0009E8130B|nr:MULTISPECIES: cytosine permease [unclassified Nocardioides]